MIYKFLIYISYSYAVPIGVPLEQEIRKRGYRVKWFSDLPETKKDLPENSEILETIEEVIHYRPDIVLTITDNVPDFISGLKVQIFHGFNPDKRSENNHFNIRGFFDLYCTQGPSTTEGFRREQKKHPHFEVVETGWSKMDPLFPIESKQKNEKPIVFIASTFSHRLSLALKEEVFQEIKRLSVTGKYEFLMVLHPKLPKEIKTKWQGLSGENFTYLNTTELNPLFEKADIMFSDTTSAIQEFMLTKKPIVTFAHNRPNSALINITEPEQIENALDTALTYPTETISEITKIAKKIHPYTDGKSSERVIDATIDFLHKDKSYLKSKPLNLIRKYKIRKRLNYFTLKTHRRPHRVPDSSYSKDHVKLTAIIPTGNEIHNIEEVINSVAFADEILVVDSFSTDGTFEKAKELATKVVQREFNYPASQKNWIIPQAKYDWILLLDADERVTPELREEIQTILKNPPKNIVGFWIGRMNHFMGERVHYSGWRNDSVTRLFQKDYCRYEDKHVHEEIIADGKVGRLKNKLYHNTYISLDKYIEKMNRYATWQALDYDKKTGKLTAYHFIVKPLWGFFKHYIVQSGFRDGVVGLTIGYVQGYTVFMRYAKLWLLRKKRS